MVKRLEIFFCWSLQDCKADDASELRKKKKMMTKRKTRREKKSNDFVACTKHYGFVAKICQFKPFPRFTYFANVLHNGRMHNSVDMKKNVEDKKRAKWSTRNGNRMMPTYTFSFRLNQVNNNIKPSTKYQLNISWLEIVFYSNYSLHTCIC